MVTSVNHQILRVMNRKPSEAPDCDEPVKSVPFPFIQRAFTSESSLTGGIFTKCPVGTELFDRVTTPFYVPDAIQRDWEDVSCEQKHYPEPFESMVLMEPGSFPCRFLEKFLSKVDQHSFVQESDKSALVKIRFEDQDYAVKVYPINSERRERESEYTLKRELGIGVDRHSPYVVRPYFAVKNAPYGNWSNCALVVMPFIEGKELHSLLVADDRPYQIGYPENPLEFASKGLRSSEGPMLLQKVHNVQKLLRDLVEGLDDLHQKGIVYRDLKPANVIAGNDHVIVDLEFAKAIPPSESAGLIDGEVDIPSLRRTKSLVGTYEFMAPEMVRRSKPYTSSVDVWSLGALMYAAVYGKHILGSAEDGCLQKLIDEKQITFYFAPKELRSLLEGMLQYDPDSRLTLGDIRKHPFYTFDPEVVVEGFANTVSSRLAVVSPFESQLRV